MPATKRSVIEDTLSLFEMGEVTKPQAVAVILTLTTEAPSLTQPDTPTEEPEEEPEAPEAAKVDVDASEDVDAAVREEYELIDHGAVRAWAKREGLEVSDRGPRVSRNVVGRWIKAGRPMVRAQGRKR